MAPSWTQAGCQRAVYDLQMDWVNDDSLTSRPDRFRGLRSFSVNRKSPSGHGAVLANRRFAACNFAPLSYRPAPPRSPCDAERSRKDSDRTPRETAQDLRGHEARQPPQRGSLPVVANEDA